MASICQSSRLFVYFLFRLIILQTIGANPVISTSPEGPEVITSTSTTCTLESGSDCSTSYISWYDGSDAGWPPVILSAPHSGYLNPASIPDRDFGCWNVETSSCLWTHECRQKNATKCAATTDDDYNTYQLTMYIRRDLETLFGHPPPTVLNNLVRAKFDANRDEPEATFDVPEVQAAFLDYNGFIDRWKRVFVDKRGFGVLIDIHGHGHTLQRAELGYIPRGSELDSGQPIAPSQTSIRSLAARFPGLDFDSLLRGNASFGAFLENYGYESVPSPQNRGPVGNIYYNGGYLTRRHGSWINGTIDAIQIESAHSPREIPVVSCYARAVACTIHRYVCAYYAGPSELLSSAERESCTRDSREMCGGLDCGPASGARSKISLPVDLRVTKLVFSVLAAIKLSKLLLMIVRFCLGAHYKIFNIM